MSLENIKEKIKLKVSDGLVDYESALKFMESEVANIISGTSPGMIWLTQHPSIYTAGISAKDKDLINPDNIPVFKTNRGGQYTYHGPGVKIIYVMLDIKKLFYPNKPDIAQFVKMLEQSIINILKYFNINGKIRQDRVGIWVKNNNGGEDKIAAIGIKVKKWVSYHGIALNINPDLDYFKGIVPCGISEAKYGVTSLKNLGQKISEEDLNRLIFQEFVDLLNYNNFGI